MDSDTLCMITDGLERIFADAPLEAIDRAGGLGAEAEALWVTFAENGFTRI